MISTTSKMDTLTNIIESIHENKLELQVMEILLHWYDDELLLVKDTCSEYKSSLTAIRKINKGKNRDIETLCEM